jgi:molybdate transport system substrate-binding protein
MRLLLILVCLIGGIPAYGDNIGVAAASDLNFAMKDIVQVFEQKTGNKVRLSLGSSGNFYAQIVNGAPFEVFLSADVDYPRRLEMQGLTVPGSTFVYGVGGISLWVSKKSLLDVRALGLQALADPSVKKIAIANPEHAPYGRAAVAAMQNAKLYERAKNKLVLGENISQAAQFVQSGAADIGIIAVSIAMSEPMSSTGTYWLIPRDTYPPLEQGAVLLKRAGPAAKAFHEWLKGPEARSIFEKYGFRAR